ncbi:Xaa-Pro aminopeptidase [Roseibium hamelinense]|uniref:Xaa-Pro aminopeptidase n=1 Tax=Roseibium hamelinense TaxID=150831 RepID=A0A562TBL4_9HYPH|nr:aminopeptidase P family protein [Roseibium hamelinense]MTI45408.1 aminopeptidase P family protein [Roseibium hamelinense]TWI90220.1 Xaa-Pro aminopeptidase [Roseibium hamelinense]
MFQNFDDLADPSCGAPHAALLRSELKRLKLDGFLVPRADAHQGEYVPPSDCRLQWLTGFSGSAGLAAVLGDEAAIFVDGRYTIQVREQVDMAVFPAQHLINEPVTAWLSKRLQKGQRLGVDAMLHTVNEVRKLKKVCEAAGAELVLLDQNPVDAVWEGRPAAPLGAVALHPLERAGRETADKIAEIQGILKDNKTDAGVLTQPDSIAWLFNIRGSDVDHTPLPLSFALVSADDKPTLFIDGRKLSNSVRDSLSELTGIMEPSAFKAELAALGDAGKTVLIDPALAGEGIATAITRAGGKILEASDPILLPKAVKNEVEIQGARDAHLRDAVAYVKFLHWFDETAPNGTLDEIGAAQKLEQFRVETGVLKDISFDTISGAGPNGAICHYRVSRSSNLKIPVGLPYLIDSGAQYEDGTTDITRTLAVGEMTAEMKRHFTLVLKGHIAISTARFPEGTSGAQLDTLARIDLWKAGLDFDHGTGHGVGSYLGVHEGPQRIAKTGSTPLKPGMILSNEPGYYPAGKYGIRLENLELVREAENIEGGERPMLGFETLTLAPFDLRLVDGDLLSRAERSWLNLYHKRVRDSVGPLLDNKTLAWLESATRPI